MKWMTITFIAKFVFGLQMNTKSYVAKIYYFPKLVAPTQSIILIYSNHPFTAFNLSYKVGVVREWYIDSNTHLYFKNRKTFVNNKFHFD